MASLAALEKLVVMILIMMIGYACAKAHWIDSRFSDMASKLLMNVFIVGTILSSVANVKPALESDELAIAVLAAFVEFILCGVVGFIVSRCIGLKGRSRNVAWLSIFFMNNVFVGFPVVEAMFGPEAVFSAALTNLPFNLLLYTVGINQLQEGARDWKERLKRTITTPLVATILAAFIFAFQIPVPALLCDTLSILGGATVPVSMIVIGVSLSAVPVREALLDWRAYVVSLSRLILCPVVVYFVLGLFLPVGITLNVDTVTAACPTAAIVTILCIQLKADDRFAAKINFLTTTLCAVSLPIVAYFIL